jgi:hypothetical protein
MRLKKRSIELPSGEKTQSKKILSAFIRHSVAGKYQEDVFVGAIMHTRFLQKPCSKRPAPCSSSCYFAHPPWRKKFKSTLLMDDTEARKYMAVMPYHGYGFKKYSRVADLHRRDGPRARAPAPQNEAGITAPRPAACLWFRAAGRPSRWRAGRMRRTGKRPSPGPWLDQRDQSRRAPGRSGCGLRYK